MSHNIVNTIGIQTKEPAESRSENSKLDGGFREIQKKKQFMWVLGNEYECDRYQKG